MANNRTTIIIDADSSRVKAAAKEAGVSLDALGNTVSRQDSNIKEFGRSLESALGQGKGSGFIMGIKRREKAVDGLGQSFHNLNKNVGKQGLRSKLDGLETPLRDTEGAFDRVSQATRIWGSSAESASEKATAGFLLAADSISAFTSGGVIGLALAAGIAAFALIANAIKTQEEASKAAAEETKKQAEALDQLASAALSAGVSILAQESLAKMATAGQAALKVDKALVENRKEQIKLLRELNPESREALKIAERGGLLIDEQASIEFRTGTARKEASAQLQKLRDAERKLSGEAISAERNLEKASSEVADERARFSQSATKRVIDDSKAMTAAIVAVIDKAKAKGSGTKAGGVGEAEKVIKERLAGIEAERRLNMQVAADNKAFDRSEAADAAAFDAEMLAAKKLREEEFMTWKRTADRKAADDAIERGRKAQESFMKVNAVQIAATRAIIGGLQQMAHDGEISFAALGDAAMTAAGNQLVASGTEHLLGGAAKAFAGAATLNPVMVAGGTAEAGQGALMIAAGLGLGAVGGAIGRSGAAPAAPSGASVPTDSRESRAASGGSGGEGGSTIIHFNGPAYDRRGVANVLTSGNRMARHRRIAGA